MVVTDPKDFQGQPVVIALSDAPDNASAIREINDWARANGFVRTREFQLGVRQAKDGHRWFQSTCVRPTEDDARAAEADLGRIRARRDAMPVTAPADQLLRDED